MHKFNNTYTWERHRKTNFEMAEVITLNTLFSAKDNSRYWVQRGAEVRAGGQLWTVARKSTVNRCEVVLQMY